MINVLKSNKCRIEQSTRIDTNPKEIRIYHSYYPSINFYLVIEYSHGFISSNYLKFNEKLYLFTADGIYNHYNHYDRKDINFDLFKEFKEKHIDIINKELIEKIVDIRKRFMDFNNNELKLLNNTIHSENI